MLSFLPFDEISEIVSPFQLPQASHFLLRDYKLPDVVKRSVVCIKVAHAHDWKMGKKLMGEQKHVIYIMMIKSSAKGSKHIKS